MTEEREPNFTGWGQQEAHITSCYCTSAHLKTWHSFPQPHTAGNPNKGGNRARVTARFCLGGESHLPGKPLTLQTQTPFLQPSHLSRLGLGHDSPRAAAGKAAAAFSKPRLSRQPVLLPAAALCGTAGPAKPGMARPSPCKSCCFSGMQTTPASGLCVITFPCNWLQANYSAGLFLLDHC